MLAPYINSRPGNQVPTMASPIYVHYPLGHASHGRLPRQDPADSQLASHRAPTLLVRSQVDGFVCLNSTISGEGCGPPITHTGPLHPAAPGCEVCLQ
jgi:hypothetical protein